MDCGLLRRKNDLSPTKRERRRNSDSGVDPKPRKVILTVRAEASVRGTLEDIEVKRRGGEQARSIEREA